MSRKKVNTNLTPAEINSENPIFMPDEPTTVGSPDNLTDEQESIKDEKSNSKKSERIKK